MIILGFFPPFVFYPRLPLDNVGYPMGTLMKEGEVGGGEERRGQFSKFRRGEKPITSLKIACSLAKENLGVLLYLFLAVTGEVEENSV